MEGRSWQSRCGRTPPILSGQDQRSTNLPLAAAHYHSSNLCGALCNLEDVDTCVECTHHKANSYGQADVAKK
ncbi:hypothetical protein E2320_023005 [Naja naja]|nr:hypothetical protein E2320_023005 [Naja naja]